MAEKITASLIFEALGRPAEHVKESLTKLVDKLEDEEKVEINDKKIAEPKKVKDRENVFSSFVEIEIETNLQKFLAIIFSYMPSNIDVITPEKLRMSNSDLNSFLNEIARKLHKYDEIAKTVLMERKKMAKQMKDKKQD